MRARGRARGVQPHVWLHQREAESASDGRKGGGEERCGEGRCGLEDREAKDMGNIRNTPPPWLKRRTKQ